MKDVAKRTWPVLPVALAALALVAFLMISGTVSTTPDVAQAQASKVRWDIIHLNAGVITAGGVAFAKTANPDILKIKLTGSGTFVAPASGGTSSAVTGGGTWETFAGAVSTGSGNYKVTKLVSWEFANLQAQVFTDDIGDTNERANGNAVLLIEYDDGSHGTLGIGCHGPGAPEGIHEGVIATKDFKTYWSAQAPVGGVDENRTLFHVSQ